MEPAPARASGLGAEWSRAGRRPPLPGLRHGATDDLDPL